MGRGRLVGTVALVALVLVLVAVHTGASWSGASELSGRAVAGQSGTARTSPASAPDAVPGSVAPSTTMGVAPPIPPPPLSSSDRKLEVLDKIAIGLGLAAVAAYLLTRRRRGRPEDEDEDGDGEDEASPPYTA